ncbi:podocalyxin isoform X2 [Dicentrarchus labrax]|uniref:podocalyxin isoform X2 n=1 Tax=Dicentrarchus labrax TaxID=13489 RepID=UPI0021F5C302|nr:podocalyxin isoform X2 [Dicentrarchus labrax]
MRATMRITWLLLSLSFLFHSVCSGDVTTPSVVDTSTSKPNVITGGTPGTATTASKEKTTQANTKPTTEVTTIAVTTSQPPTTLSSAGVKDITPAAGTPGTTKDMTPLSVSSVTSPSATTTRTNNSSGPKVGTNQPNVVTTQTNTTQPNVGTTQPNTTQPNVGTTQPNTTQHNVGTTQPNTAQHNVGTTQPNTAQHNVGTTQPNTAQHNVGTTQPNTAQHSVGTFQPNTGQNNVGTTQPSSHIPQQQSTAHSIVASKMSTGGENTVTPSAPSTLTKAGPTATETKASDTKAETRSPQATSTLKPKLPTFTIPTTAAPHYTFLYSLNSGTEINTKEKDLVEVCRRLMANMQEGNCTLIWYHHNGQQKFEYVAINGKVKTNLATMYYEDITKKPTDNKTLIAILASCGALLIMIVILAVCASHHRKPYNENQQHLTEELHTVENGYHDNPTLEVMEVQPEMQEKKIALNGEFNDSWLVPFDNLLKEDIPDEEDTHL